MTKKKIDPAVEAEARANQARAALQAARDNHLAAVEAEAAARAAKQEAEQAVRQGKADGQALADAIHAVTAAALRIEGAAEELEQAEKAHRVATAEHLALALTASAAEITPAADLRRELSDSITPAVVKATQAALAHNRSVAQAERFAREAELYDVGTMYDGVTAAETMDAFAPIALESAHPTASLLLHGKPVEKLRVQAVVEGAVKRAIGDALTAADLPVPDSLRVATASSSVYAVDEDVKADVLALARRMLAQELPKHYRVEVVGSGMTVGIPELNDGGEALVRVGYVEAKRERSGTGIEAAMRLGVYHRDADAEPDALMQALGNRGKHRGTGKPCLVETQIGADMLTGGRADTGYRVDLDGVLCDWGTLELSGIRFGETLPARPAPKRVPVHPSYLSPGPDLIAPGSTPGTGTYVHRIDYESAI